MNLPVAAASRSDRGQGTVEFAMIAMAFFLIVFGIMEGGRLLFTYHQVNHAAREGGRFAAAQGFYSGDVSSAGEVEAYVLSVTSGLDLDRLSIEADWPGDPNIAHCAEDPNRNGCPVVVRASYDFEPVIGMVFGMGNITINSSTAMRIHY